MIVALWFITSGNFKVKESHHLLTLACNQQNEIRNR